MTEPGSHEHEPKPSQERMDDEQLGSIFDAQDLVTRHIRDGAEKIGSPKFRERLTGAVAIVAAALHSVRYQEGGQRLSRLLRVRRELEMSDLDRLDTDVRRSLDRLDGFVSGGIDIYVELDLEGCIYSINEAITKAAGYEPEGLDDMKFIHLVHPDDLEMVEGWFGNASKGKNEEIDFRFRALDGDYRWMSATANTIVNSAGEPYSTGVRMNDITQRKQLEENLEEIALVDSGTGLRSKYFFNQEMDRLRISRGEEYPVSIIFIDMDDFKALNKRLGHPVADQLLRDFAELLNNHFRIRKSDIVARFGGDEFVVLLKNCPPEIAEQHVQTIKDLMAWFNEYKTKDSDKEKARPYEIHASVGTATASSPDLLDTALNLADLNMYDDKDDDESGPADLPSRLVQ
jgi:diguanylate cyclase (GGDEF)-like protein/PAS domain S-box-containing protein